MKKACFLLALAAPGADAATAAATDKAGSKLMPMRHHHSSHRRHHKAALAQTAEPAPQTEEPPVDLSKLPPIPPAPSTGPDGFPHLPTVHTMLGDADQTMRSISEQASTLEKRVVAAQMEKAAKMERQKAVFEQKLHAQEDENLAMVAANDAISKEIATLEAGNTALTKQARELQADNARMRSELDALRASLASAGSYAAETLAESDDSHAEALAVLSPAAAAAPAVTESVAVPKPHHRHHEHDKVRYAEADDADDDAQVEDDEEDDDLATAFVETRAARLRATARRQDPPKGVDVPGNIVGVLQQGLEALQTQERASEDKLKALFIADFQAGSQRHNALVVHRKALNWTRSNLLSMQARLKAAEAHLSGTKGRLEERVRGLGLFVQRLAHLALAPAAEVPNLLKALPTNITAASAPLLPYAATPETPAPAAPAAATA